MNPLTTLKSAIQVVGVLLAAFGGFLLGLAPPEETGVKIAVGLVSVLCLVLFLLITAMAPTLGKRAWLTAAVMAAASFAVSALIYQREMQHLTFVWPPSGVVYVGGGATYMPKAFNALQREPSLSSSDLVSGFGGIDKDRGIDTRTAVWPQAAIFTADRTLTLVYVWIVVSAALAVFCALEGAIGSGAPGRGKAKR